MKKIYITLIVVDTLVLVWFLIWYWWYNNHFSFFSHSQMDHSKMDHGSMISDEESFLKLMIPHHQEAIDTSKIVLEKTSSPELKTLLQNIISAQVAEVQIMTETVENLYKNEKKFEYQNMMNPDLANMSWEDAEKSYLEWMILHHEGAIQMANAMKDKDMQDSTRKIVENIIASQQSEIDFMKSLLNNYK